MANLILKDHEILRCHLSKALGFVKYHESKYSYNESTTIQKQK